MNKKFLTTSIFIFFFTAFLFAQDSLAIIDYSKWIYHKERINSNAKNAKAYDMFCHQTADCVKYASNINNGFCLMLCGMNMELRDMPDQAISFYEKAIEKGDDDAIYRLGCLYGKQNYNKAISLFKQASSKGHPWAACALYDYYMYSSADRSKEEYVSLLKPAIASGDFDGSAAHALGLVYEEMSKDYARYMHDAFRYYKMSAEKGNPHGQKMLGLCFLDGKEVEKDIEEGVRWLRRAAENGENKAKLYLGSQYYKLYLKSGKEKDLIQALRWTYKSAYTEDGEIIGDIFAHEDLSTYYRDSLFHAEKYKDENSWVKYEIAPLAKDSDADINIPQSNKINDNYYVLIIANEDYKHEEYVPYAEKDGEVFQKYCQSRLGIPTKNIRFITNAGYNDINFQIDWLSDCLKAADNRVGILYYSGHGMPADDQTTSFLIPADGYAKDSNSSINLMEVYSRLATTNNSKCILLMDACFSGVNKKDQPLLSSKGVKLNPATHITKGNIVSISACSGKETASVNDYEGHGIFTYHLLKYLKNNMNVSLGELFENLQKTVNNSSMEKIGRPQNPSVFFSPALEGFWKDIQL